MVFFFLYFLGEEEKNYEIMYLDFYKSMIILRNEIMWYLFI